MSVFSPNYNEQELLSQLALGNKQAYSAIYMHYHKGVYNYLLKFTKDPAATEDLVHDVFLKIWEIRDQVQIKSSFASYLYRFARNAAITQLNRLTLYNTIRDEVLYHTSLRAADHTLMNDIESQQYEKLLEKAIADLPLQRRKAFILCRQKGKTYEEAAAIMNISKNTLKQHLSLAVKDIKEYLLKYADISFLMLLVLLK